jgi:hypothetical protein
VEVLSCRVCTQLMYLDAETNIQTHLQTVKMLVIMAQQTNSVNIYARNLMNQQPMLIFIR